MVLLTCMVLSLFSPFLALSSAPLLLSLQSMVVLPKPPSNIVLTERA